MSEVSGRMVVRIAAPEKAELLAALPALDDCYSLAPLEHLVSLAGVSLDVDGEDLEIEESEVKSGLAYLSLFGSGWLAVLRQMVSVKGLEFWASLWDEDGIDYYFSLVGGCAEEIVHDMECGDMKPGEAEEKADLWLQGMPELAREWMD